MALGALVSFHAGGARADGTAAEIRFLKERLKQLEAKVAKQDRQQKETQSQVRHIAKSPAMPPAPETPMVCKDAPCPPPPPPISVSFTNGLKVESWDQAFSFKIGGRIIVDGGINSFPAPAFAGKAPLPAVAASGFSNQVGFRQVRLDATGTAYHDWDYKWQYDFVGSPNDLIVGGIRDAFIAWRRFAPFTFQVGNFFEPDGLERSASSTKYRDFIERSFAGDVLGGSRHIGFAAIVGGDAPGILGNSNYSAKGGIFSTSVEDGNPNAVGAPAAGNSGFLNPIAGGHQYWDAAGRITYAPILTEDALLHVGGSVRYQNPNDATAATDDRVLQPGSTFKTEANVLNENLLGTQPLTCSASAATQLLGTNCAKDYWQFGAEAVGSYGPFSIQAEYSAAHYDRNAAIIEWLKAPGGTSVNFSGYYVYATWYLTGESRAQSYLTYAKDYTQPGGYGQINILHPVSAGGYGAWEAAARFDEINLNSGGYLVTQAAGVPSNIQGGRETDLTFGLNWYPDKGIRFMANWVNVLQLAAPWNRPNINGIHPQIFLMRAQVDW
jgi:phosphate-selective porin OprO and OprP